MNDQDQISNSISDEPQANYKTKKILNDVWNKKNNGNTSSVIPEVVSAVTNTENNGNPNENTDIEPTDYDKPFYVYIIYYKNIPLPVVIGNKINELQFPIYMINNTEGVDRIGYFRFDNEDGLYETDIENLISASKLTSPVFYKNIDEIIKTKSTDNYIISSNKTINTWDSIKIENPNVRYNLDDKTTLIENYPTLYKHEIPGDGNCFFTAVAHAFYTINIQTTVEKLKEILYSKLDYNKDKEAYAYVDIKNYYQDLYNNCADETKMSAEGKLDCPHIKSFFGFDASNKTYQKEFDDNTFKDFFMSPNCWANEMIIALLSEILQITFLIHGTSNDSQQNNPETPYDHSILLEYSNGNHYDLILQKIDDKSTYKGIFTKDEVTNTEDIKKYFSIN